MGVIEILFFSAKHKAVHSGRKVVFAALGTQALCFFLFAFFPILRGLGFAQSENSSSFFLSLLAAPNQNLPNTQTKPYKRSSFSRMLITRREVSHIACTLRGEKPVLVLVVHHAGIWAWHSQSHVLYLKQPSAKLCLKTLELLDKKLELGLRLQLHLQGSWIVKIEGL